MATNEPFTIFGDIGELANSRLEPNASFISRVSGIGKKDAYGFRVDGFGWAASWFSVGRKGIQLGHRNRYGYIITYETL